MSYITFYVDSLRLQKADHTVEAKCLHERRDFLQLNRVMMCLSNSKSLRMRPAGSPTTALLWRSSMQGKQAASDIAHAILNAHNQALWLRNLEILADFAGRKSFTSRCRGTEETLRAFWFT
jgi:hypothetical protein